MFGYICITKKEHLDTRIGDSVVEFSGGCQKEKKILAEAMEMWLFTFDFPSGNSRLDIIVPDVRPEKWLN